MTDRLHGYGRPEDWDDLFYDRVEDIEAEGGDPPEGWGRNREGTRIVMDESVALNETDELETIET